LAAVKEKEKGRGGAATVLSGRQSGKLQSQQEANKTQTKQKQGK
jgi:hypothetical protein